MVGGLERKTCDIAAEGWGKEGDSEAVEGVYEVCLGVARVC